MRNGDRKADYSSKNLNDYSSRYSLSLSKKRSFFFFGRTHFGFSPRSISFFILCNSISVLSMHLPHFLKSQSCPNLHTAFSWQRLLILIGAHGLWWVNHTKWKNAYFMLGEKIFLTLLLVANKEACTLVATGDHFTTTRETALEGRRAGKWKEPDSWVTMLEVGFASGLPVMWDIFP